MYVIPLKTAGEKFPKDFNMAWYRLHIMYAALCENKEAAKTDGHINEISGHGMVWQLTY